MEEDDPVTILGLMLTQVRTARRALEEVERNTARYMGFEFARALSEGANFGAPPMFRGALMVHVVNINDLAPGNGFGGFLQTVLGGLGNFVGGLLGGAVGGTLSALALPWMIGSLERIVSNVRAIIDRIGGGAGEETAEAAASAQPDQTPTDAVAGASLVTQVESVNTLVRNLTALFQVAASGPNDTAGANAAGRRAPEVLTDSGAAWMAILQGVNTLLDRTLRIVTGLTGLIPIVIGSIALLVANLGGIRRELLLTMQFILRNVLVLRGVILTTIFETISAVARLAASVVTMLGTALQSALSAVIGVIGGLLDAAFDTLATLASALQAVIQSLLQWLVNDVFTILRAIGGLTVFRTVDHFARVLPSLLEPIYMIVVAYQGGQTQRLPDDLSDALTNASAAGLSTSNPGNSPGAPGAGIGPTIIGQFPNLSTVLAPLSGTLEGAVSATGAGLSLAMERMFSLASGTLGGLAGTFDGAIRREAAHSQAVLGDHFDVLTASADRLADTITAPIDAVGPATGFEDIAAAYQSWLTTDGGLDGILTLVTEHFLNSPGGNASVPGLLRGGYDRPRASIEIETVEIVIEPAADLPDQGDGILGPGDFPTPELTDESIWLAWLRHSTELEVRGINPEDLRTLYA